MAVLGFIFGLCIMNLVCRADAVQTRGPRQRLHPPQIDPSLQAVMPIEWVHVPKTGTSFMNTLMHIPGVCPSLPADLVVSSESMGSVSSPLLVFAMNYSHLCNASLWDASLFRIDHFGIDVRPGFEEGKGRFMMFMRPPEHVIISDYYYDMQILNLPMPPFRDYAHTHMGVVTKMLTRKSKLPEDSSPPSQAEVDEAKIRLQTGFSFIGMTEQWNLSICLFNKMFNQKCQHIQFSNTNPGLSANDETKSYNTTELKLAQDPYDRELYEIGKHIFDANLRTFGVNQSSCELCWREAGLL